MATESKALKLRCDTLRRIAAARTPELAKVNAALRELVVGVVIDHPTGYLAMRWRSGGETSLFVAFPNVRRGRPEG